MKLILREKNIDEAELKASPTFTNASFAGIYQRVLMGYQSGGTTIDIPIRELLYEKSKPLVVGAILQYFANVKHEKLKSNQTLISNWIPEQRFFKQDFVDAILNSVFPIGLSYGASSLQALGATGITNINGVVTPIITINPERHIDLGRMMTTIRHETQHVTQFFGDICLYHYELLKRAGFDFIKIEEPDYSPTELSQQSGDKVKLVKLVGRGKQQTHALQQGKPPQVDPNASEEEYERAMLDFSKQYFRDDAEFETWVSDLSTYTIDFAMEHVYSVDELIPAYLKTKFPMLAGSRLNEDIRAIKALKTVASKLRMPYEDLRSDIKIANSLSQFAKDLARMITTDEGVMNAIADDYGNKAIKYALKAFPTVRPREFQRDFTARLEEKLMAAIEQKYPFLSTL